MSVHITALSGQEVLPYLDDLARLRIEVFRAFPYLYDGDMGYERRYLATYADSPESFFVLAQPGVSQGPGTQHHLLMEGCGGSGRNRQTDDVLDT
ncbi:hypothetical protein SAMN05216203_0117 [Marinobacter daqiaonensis]|uniref:Uncharacterized protein n=1 Tax=Marinobacter daqiaonensis TaxID=650891 RepID=A0A1I6GHV0_9GAMM|nr:hypothetical protein SAMN05216203_0117 [Marinobacter daqiaonensis]